VREIDDEGFAGCSKLKSFPVPSSVVTIGGRCFEDCKRMTMIRFADVSQLKRIGEHAFRNCRLISIIIPASVEEIDGSAFVGCPLLVIEVASGNRNFRIQGCLLTTADGTKIVRCFGRESVVVVPKTVEVLGVSCFESCNHIQQVVFEAGSKLRQIGSSAFSGCGFLTTITIPASVEMIGDFGFKNCDGLEACLMAEDAVLVKIGKDAFADCCSLRSFYFPKTVGKIDENFFVRCGPLHLLTFGAGVSLREVIGDVTLDEGLQNIGFAEISCLFTIEVSEEGVSLDFPGWISVGDDGSALVLIQANE
jgi:hypothetical protein